MISHGWGVPCLLLEESRRMRWKKTLFLIKMGSMRIFTCLLLEAIPLLGEMSAKWTKGFTSPLKEKVAAWPSDEVEYYLKVRTPHHSTYYARKKHPRAVHMDVFYVYIYYCKPCCFIQIHITKRWGRSFTSKACPLAIVP